MRRIVKQSRSVLLLLCLTAAVGIVSAQDQQPAAPDNTKQNKTQGMTADNQKEDKADRTTTQKIRKAILADKSLSSYAHNIKVITANSYGHVMVGGQ